MDFRSVPIPEPVRMLKRRLLRKREGKRGILHRFKEIHGREFDPQNVQTFTEKLCREMLDLNQHPNPLFTRLADKLLVRDYVRERVGSQYLIPLIWSGGDPAKIPFEDLPSKTIAKTNHSSGGHIILAHPIHDHLKIIRSLRKSLKKNHYWSMREGHYYDIKPRALVELFIDDGHADGPLDYRFWCFNGHPALIQVDNSLHDINPFYDTKWTKLDLSYRRNAGDSDIAGPENLEEMLSVASELSSGINFVRVDLYNVQGQIYFGEMTFTPMAGFFKFSSDEWDRRLGEMWI